jgi:apolipoprotein N-acyltransferase
MEFSVKQRLLLLLSTVIMLSAAWISGGFSLFIALVPILLVEDYYERNKEKYKSGVVYRQSFLVFILWHAITNWWIGHASVAGVIMVIFLNSFFYASVFWLFHWAKRNTNKSTGYAFFLLIWISFEYIHTYWELSWPWMNLGNWLGKSIYFIQWYEFTGVEGGSLWIILSNLLLLFIVQKTISGGNKREINIAISTFLALLIIPSLISVLMYTNYHEKGREADVVVIQPNVDPYREKYDNELHKKQLANILRLSASIADTNVDYFVGPETAFPRGDWENNLSNNNTLLTLRKFLKNYPGAKYIIGLSSYRLYEPGEQIPATARPLNGNTARYYDRYNTAIQVDSTQKFELYHKSKFVIGVEKMPFLHLIPALEKLAMDFGGIIGSLGSDNERKTFEYYSDEFRVGPIICYESVYGQFVTEYIKKGANLLFVITNDGWWDNTPGHRMHLMHSQLRAIETRRSVARSANTGVSCFISQKGKISQATKYWEENVIRQKLIANDEITFYVKFGDAIGRISLFMAVLMLFYVIVKTIVPKKNRI